MPNFAQLNPFAIPYPGVGGTGTIDVSKNMQGIAGAYSRADTSGYSGAYLSLKNDSDSWLFFTWDNSASQYALAPGEPGVIPIRYNDTKLKWLVQAQNAVQAHPLQQLVAIFLEPTDVAAGYPTGNAGPINPSTPAGSIGPGALPEGVTIEADDVGVGPFNETFGPFAFINTANINSGALPAGVTVPPGNLTAGALTEGVTIGADDVGSAGPDETLGVHTFINTSQVNAGVLPSTVVAQNFGPTLAGAFFVTDSGATHLTTLFCPQPAASARGFQVEGWDGTAAHTNGALVDSLGNRNADRLISSLAAVYLDVTNTSATDDVKIEGAGATAKDLQLFGYDGSSQHVGLAAINGGGAKLFTSLGDRGIVTKDNSGSIELDTFGPASTALDILLAPIDASNALHVVLKAPGASQVVQSGTDDNGTKRLIQSFIGNNDPAGRSGITANEGDLWFPN